QCRPPRLAVAARWVPARPLPTPPLSSHHRRWLDRPCRSLMPNCLGDNPLPPLPSEPGEGENKPLAHCNRQGALWVAVCGQGRNEGGRAAGWDRATGASGGKGCLAPWLATRGGGPIL